MSDTPRLDSVLNGGGVIEYRVSILASTLERELNECLRIIKVIANGGNCDGECGCRNEEIATQFLKDVGATK